MPSLPHIAKITGRLAQAVALILALLFGVLWGLIGSQPGTRFITEQAQAWLGESVSWTGIDGKLTGPLTLRGLTISLPDTTARISRLEIDWQPTALLSGELHVTRLAATDIALTLTAAEDTGSTESPVFDPTSLRTPFDVRVDEFSLARISVRQETAEPLMIDEVEMAARLQGGVVSLEHLGVRAPEGEVAIRLETALESAMPLDLEIDWRSTPEPGWLPVAASNTRTEQVFEGTLSLQGDLAWGDGVGFDVAYDTETLGLQWLEPSLPAVLPLEGRIQGRQQSDQVNLDSLSVQAENSAIALTLAGRLTDLATAPEFDLKIGWQTLHWPLFAAQPAVTSESGEWEVSGSPENYQLSVTSSVEGLDIPPTAFELEARGGLNNLTIDALSAETLGGVILAAGTVGWSPIPAWEIEVIGNQLAPGALLDAFSGQVDLAASTQGEFDAALGPKALLDVTSLEGVLMERPFQLEAETRIDGEQITVERLRLASEDNTLNAVGSLEPDALAIDWEANIANLGAVVPEADGKIVATGTVKGSTDSPLLSLEAHGDALSMADLQLSAFQVRGTAGMMPDDPLEATLTLGQALRADVAVLEQAEFSLSGTLQQHRAHLRVNSPSEQLDLAVGGSADLPTTNWSGLLEQVVIATEDFGNWKLQAPASLSLAPERIALAEFCLASESHAGALCIEGVTEGGIDDGIEGRLEESREEAGISRVALSLEALPVDAIAPQLTGTLSGKGSATLGVTGEVRADAKFSLSAGDIVLPEEMGGERLEHGGGDVTLSVDEQGLLGDFYFSAPEDGEIRADLRLPKLTTLPPAGEQPLLGKLRLDLPRLDAAAVWIPEVSKTQGVVEADITLAGTLAQPEVLGKITLGDGSVDFPSAGLNLREVGFTAESDPENANRLVLRGGMQSGTGHVGLEGSVDVSDMSLDLQVGGVDLTVYDTPDARVRISPDLAMGWRDSTLRLRGQLAVPEAAITPRLQLRSATTGATTTAEVPGQVLMPSPDVVVINGGVPATESELPTLSTPFAIDSEIQLLLGDSVSIDALGFRSRIDGAVTFVNQPDSTDLIPLAEGRLNIKDGTFRAFGQNLQIETGRLIFADGPATAPELKVRAVRWIDNDPQVTAAGVLVTGPVDQPVLELFSRPQLEVSEIQSYLLTGTSAADRTNVLSVGTYVAPRLYVGYGYNVLESTSEFNSLFNITPRFGVSANAGAADSNANLTVTYEN